MPGRPSTQLGELELARIQREAMAFAGIGLVRYAMDGTVLHVDATALEIIELSGRLRPEDAIGLDIGELYVVDTRPGALRALVKQRGAVKNREYRLTTLGGRRKWVLVNAYLVTDERTDLEAVQLVARDITEAKLAAEERRRSEEWFSRVVETIPDGVTVLDTAGQIVFANRAAERILGLTRGEITSRSFDAPQWRITAVSGRPIPPEELPFSRVMASGLPVFGMQHAIERPGGARVVLSVNAAPLRDGNGVITGVLASLTDITHRRQTEEELAEAQALLRAAIEQSPAGILIADAPDVRIRLANPAALGIRGHTSASLTGIAVEEHAARWQTYDPDGRLLPPEELPLSRAVLEGHVSRNVEVRIRRDGAEDRWVLANAAPVRNARGEVVAGVVVFPDVTELKETQAALQRAHDELERRVAERTAALEEANRSLGREMREREQAQQETQLAAIQLAVANRELESFAYSVSHDLRAPLRAIDGFSAALLEHLGEALDGQGLRYLERVRAASHRMAEIIDDLLKLSRLSRREMHRQPVDLSRLVEDLVAERREAEPDRRVEVVIAPGVTADGDASLLRIALGNLLDNAWKFTRRRERPRIEFAVVPEQSEHAQRGGGRPVYCIRDNGAGFDMAYAAKLFGAFQRLHGQSEFPGAGIGLATAQRVFVRHGGRIWAEGAVDEGASFYFTL